MLFVAVLAGILVLLVAACAPPAGPAGAPSGLPPGPVEQAAVKIAARDLDVDPALVKILSVEEVTWPDATLGCPREGIMGAQVLTPGYKVVVEVEGAAYNVHMNSKGQGLVCF